MQRADGNRLARAGLSLNPEDSGRIISNKAFRGNQNPSIIWERRLCYHKDWERRSDMPTAKELTIHLEDRPGTLGKVCRALADRGVNILAFQSSPSERDSLVRFLVDNPTMAKKVLDNQGLSYTEADVAQVKLPHRPGELARVASQLGEANININYVYGGVDPSTNAPLLIFGVKEVELATVILDRATAAAA